MENKNNFVTGVTLQDKRGIKPSPKIISEAEINNVHKQISSFPAYVSHYTRKTKNKIYLSAYLNLSKMYGLYRSETPNLVGITI